MSAIAERERANQEIARFEIRFDPSYRLLVQHVALPLVLTPELVNFIRNRFLRPYRVPWVAEVDLLLSDLCRPAGFELYVMPTAVRSRLLEELQADERFGRRRIEAIAKSLMAYNQYLERTNGLSAPLLQAQQWAAMVYLEQHRDAAVRGILAELSRCGAVRPEVGRLLPVQPAELARLAQIVQELAPELQEYGNLVDYARLITQVRSTPEAVGAEEVEKPYAVLGTELHLPAELVPDGLTVAAAATGDLQSFEFETATVEVVEPADGSDVTLQSFEFETAQIRRAQSQAGWDIQRSRGSARQWVEDLGNGVALEMVFVPGGTFAMGSPDDEPENRRYEKPQHEVKVSPFFLGKYPITQAQWRAVAALPQVERELKSSPSRFKGDNRPVERVSWYEAVEFCQRLSRATQREYRLPSEAEWEYACRAGTTTPFYFGETITTDLANYAGSPTTEVGKFPANAFGLYDMHGNVWEWCADDWHDNYQGAPENGNAWIDEKRTKIKVKLLRGGSWYFFPRRCRCAFRYHSFPVSSGGNLGFRVVGAAARTLR